MRRDEPSSDPGLARGEGGITLLQARLRVYAKALVLINVGYWPAFLLVWSLEPASGWDAALRHAISPEVLALNVVYATIWIGALGKPRPPVFLQTLDVAGNAAIGVAFAFIMLTHPSRIAAVFENLLALVCVLAVRALVVPSPPWRTCVAGALMTSSTVLAVLFSSSGQTEGFVTRATLVSVVASWCAVAIAFSTVASAVLYGLRREVRDARRLGQYTLLDKLGEGGMGAVYRASHALLRRPTAIKLLSRGGTGTVERFEREVQLLAGLNHPNTVTIHDYGRTADGTFYYAMELLDGLDLEDLVALDGAQPAARVVRIVREAARGLAEAHELGLIHRDIKPANIFLCRHYGQADAVKVLDFGLAKDLVAGSDDDLTGSRTFLGTPLYLAPEAMSGRVLPDGRSDLYSLGAVAYFLLTGVPVFEGRTAMEVCAHHLHTAPVPPGRRNGRAVPADVEAVVLRCLAKEPDARFATAAELVDALAACDDAATWSAKDAAAWWSTHGDRVERWRAERRRAQSGTLSVVAPARDANGPLSGGA